MVAPDDIDTTLVDSFVATHYDELKRIARAKRRSMPGQGTMLTTDLLHETWLKLRVRSEWHNEAHFFRTAAMAMRQVIVDAARQRLREKRGGNRKRLDFDEVVDVFPNEADSPEDIVGMNALLERLDVEAPHLSDVVNLRYFGGMTESEAAVLLNVSKRTVRRHWQLARAWIIDELEQGR